ncbi:MULTISPECIES: 50S ribosomal protein L9 [Sporomusa]|jgi:hypothetical protein|uniref:YtxH-like protein n=1 Tax=Sporomusa sphaeroides DSM 2875 TaxID=1337886 RepID=A0ABM9W6M0_9FIRM|nr:MULTISPECIES: 50S ribosomal protein L9 [Sporomusa]MCM0758180.1 hypothetical protein [Sporomusa sphaeroides DSM 2875]OLS54562.1 hypothetical protein SPSPH_43470 [Sporomusa sphaeroides DSM 2875]CVK20794.1 hypothetical protein SSPH_03462 [Sporomusa sphaeroides DSM 2875]HML32848.1 hypothetical protein [Sporomusa sphaeroides]
MFARSDFWIGLVVGTIAGAFGYKLMSEQQSMRSMAPAMQMPAAQGVSEIPVDELMRQKERLEDLIAEHQANAAKG